ncbi:MAG: diacylglycerol kinase family protein [Sphingomonas sp.]
MQRLWFITNPHSGSSDAAKAEAILAIFVERGLTLAGRTDFPAAELPTPGALAKADVDTVVLFAGDGTINAAVRALAEWDGAILVLPGGTMNMLAKSLHGDADPAAIILAAHDNEHLIPLPFVEAGKHRALVGLIVGPAANWFRARESIRERKLADLWPAVRTAWRRTFGKGIRLAGAPGFPARAQAAYVRADEDGLAIMAIDARDFRSVADLGWNLITGDWVAAHAVTEIHAPRLTIAERRPVLALFDGEPVTLDPATAITAGRTAEQFIATKAPI